MTRGMDKRMGIYSVVENVLISNIIIADINFYV